MPEVKVCGLKDEQNILEVSQLAVTYLGLIFVLDSKRYIGNDLSLPQGLSQSLVGVFVNEPFEGIAGSIERYHLDVVQLHGDETPHDIGKIKEAYPEITVWKTLGVGEHFPAEQIGSYADLVDAFLFDTACESRGGSGVPFNWTLLDQYQADVPFILSGGVGCEDASAIIDLCKSDSRLQGIDINSRFERSAGLKDVELIREFLAKLEE